MTAHRFELAEQSPTGHAWREDAACRGEPPERFTEPAGTDDVRQALATCANCPVRQPCLQTALTLERHADLGIWGGTTETTRRRIRDGRLNVDDVLHRYTPAAERTPAEVLRLHQAATRDQLLRTTRLPDGRNDPQAHEDAPLLPVTRDKHGDYIDATGRVIIFRIHGQPPWMLMVDGRCHTRSHTLTAAQQVAWQSRNLAMTLRGH